uniref:NmrA-like domain-containing protein n=1 Tax=Fusarium oxysporum (strain Fo5176) TaxID=660025 RepID=A0A0D2YJJ1_FUSOF
MSNKKIIAVIGSTGSQGGSVVDIFLNDPLTIGKGDLNNKLSLVKAFTGATAVFGVTNYWESMSTDTEIQQGKNIVDAAKNEGAWVFAVPMPESAPIPIFDVRDTGIWVKAIVLKKDQLLGKRVLGSTRYTTPLEVVDAFKTAFPEAGEKAGFYSLPHDAFLQGVKESMGAPDWVAEEVLENMRLVAEGGYFAFEPLDDSHAALVGDKPTSLIDFLRGHKSFKDLK